ncbi:MAG: Z1 domain-containing protein [Clostridia bacterium]
MNRKKDLEMKYWNRYKQYLINDKGFPISVVNTMDDVSNELTDLLGDPMEGNFQRRGLIIGDVQSGKTANYSGLICKAVDAGYKVIVLLTGTIEKLRKQTQLRIDEAFIGMDSDAMIKQKKNIIVGAGQYDSSLNPVSLTSKSSDFNAKQANNLVLTLNSLNDPVIFVIKKNVAAMRKLNEWFKRFNTNGINKINTSLLMIDDESDNASINTNQEDRDPTITNSLIVEMLSIFNKASYVGFTATPFANIFIDPDTDNAMKNENLFPKDYIYSLKSPSNYIGARNIFPEGSEHRYMLRIIEDGNKYYPEDHKKEDTFYSISESLYEAINTFILANVIRDLRGDINTHRSMIVNISRYVNIQDQMYDLINNYLKEVQNSARLFCNLTIEEGLKDKNLSSLKKTFENEYSKLDFKWIDIQKKLYNSIASMQVSIVNQKNKGTLNYEENEKNGLRVIVIGGMSLSRGLTLEGLIVSYFLRNSKMYDTLMQMGRWFGYRNNYADLCRIWINSENKEWYTYINEASDELLQDVKRMKDMKLTPLAFGFRVRNDIDSLLVTARNKMRTRKEIKMNVSLSGEVIETPFMYNDQSKNDLNFANIKLLIENLASAKISLKRDIQNNKVGFYDIEKEYILKLLYNSDYPSINSHFDPTAVGKFIENYKGNELDLWDIVFVSGVGSEISLNDEIMINQVQRSYDIIPEMEQKFIRINKTKTRLGNPDDPKFGLSKEKELQVEKEFQKLKSDNKTSSIGNKYYFLPSIKRNPLLMIYLVELKQTSDYTPKVKSPIVGLGIGIPFLSDEKTKYAIYQVNKIFYNLGEIDFGDEE